MNTAFTPRGAEPGTLALSLRGVHKSAPTGMKQTILHGLDLDVEQGAFIALLGPSGCGKSTLLRLIAGLDMPDHGIIEIDGRDVHGVPPAARKLSMVFQSYALFPHLSVAENVAFGLRVRGVGAAERKERVAKAIGTTGLAGLEQRKPGALSGGQRQRVALARAIVAGHSLCLMDEPLSNLDAKLRHAVRLEIRELQRRLGMTVIYVTHDQSEAMGMADRVVLMNAGRIEQSGTPEDLYLAPVSTFAAAFIGSPPMVLLPDSSLPVSIREDRPCLTGIRPEHLQITAPDDDVVNGTVDEVEFQGAESFVYIKTAHQDRIIVRAGNTLQRILPRKGDRVGVTWHPQDRHLFDADSGMRVAATTTSAVSNLRRPNFDSAY